jgi:hypothetical protein
MIEERKSLLKKLEENATGKGFKSIATDYGQKANDLQLHIDKLKEILFAIQNIDVRA